MQQERFPLPPPANRAQAASTLTGGGELPVPCLTPLIRSQAARPATPAARLAVAVLRRPVRLAQEQRHAAPDGTLARFTTARGTFDRTDSRDEDRNGRPDLVDEALGAVVEARDLLRGELGLAVPGPLELVLASVGYGLEGYFVPSGPEGRPRIVVGVTPGVRPETVRRATIHQYAHAVAAQNGAGLPPAWGEALATWAVMRLTGGPHEETARLLSHRLERFESGLAAEDLELAAGNAIWLAFLEQAYGPAAVMLTVEELATGAASDVAVDRALRRAVGETLSRALREFHVWSLLVGDRSDSGHFSFSSRLESPAFATTATGLPALSVRAPHEVAPLGGSAVLLRPEVREGGLRIQFDGDFAIRWEVDLVLVGRPGELRRLAVPLDADGRGETIVPLDGVGEAILLIRNLGGETAGEGRGGYRWAADRLRGYPVELAALDARWQQPGAAGVAVAWETRTEQNLLGFNVLRASPDGREPVKVNPVWIPAVGDEAAGSFYQYLDLGADAESAGTYRIQAVTLDGLTSLSPAVEPAPAAPSR